MPRRRKSRYDIPVTVYVEIGDQAQALKLATAGIPHPYDVRKVLPRLLREVADDLEEMANDPGRP